MSSFLHAHALSLTLTQIVSLHTYLRQHQPQTANQMPTQSGRRCSKRSIVLNPRAPKRKRIQKRKVNWSNSWTLVGKETWTRFQSKMLLHVSNPPLTPLNLFANVHTRRAIDPPDDTVWIQPKSGQPIRVRLPSNALFSLINIF